VLSVVGVRTGAADRFRNDTTRGGTTGRIENDQGVSMLQTTPEKSNGRAARSVRASRKEQPLLANDQHLTDLGNARRLVAQHGKSLRHCWAWRKWLVWDGRRWCDDDTGHVMRLAKDTVSEMFNTGTQEILGIQHELRNADADERRLTPKLNKAQKLQAWALKSEGAARLNAAVDLARSESGVPIQPDALDTDHFKLNVRNGTINLRTGELLPHNPKDHITKLAPVEYDPGATCPLWEKFLHRIMDGNANLISDLQRVVGYAMTGDVREQCLFFFHGKGANGKSTFLDVFQAMLGDYAMQGVAELLMVRSGEQHPTERADLAGKRCVATVETENGTKMAESLIKQLTGGDRVRAAG
jgi:putative DNA primase/helicase